MSALRRGSAAIGGAPSCELGRCDGSGWVETDAGELTQCECRSLRIRRHRASGLSSVIPRKYRGVSFDRPPVTQMPSSVVRHVRRFAEGVDGRLDEGEGLWLIGDVGTGKTTLAMLISRYALEAGRTVGIYSAPSLLARIRRTYDAGPGEDSYLELFERLASVDLLHIDDLGAEKRTDWVLEQFYAIINERYESRRSMLVTANAGSTEELKEQVGERTISRLIEICGDPIPLYGPDRREIPHFELPPEDFPSPGSLGQPTTAI